MADPEKFAYLADRLPPKVAAAEDKIFSALSQLDEKRRKRKKDVGGLLAFDAVSAALVTWATVSHSWVLLMFIGLPFGLTALFTLGFFAEDEDDKEERKRLEHLLRDDRVSMIVAFLKNRLAWDRDVKVINRLIDQATLNLISLDDVQPLIDRLKADEKFLLGQMTYVERLLEEGKLGSSTGADRTPMQLADQMSERLMLVEKNKEELQERLLLVNARLELEK